MYNLSEKKKQFLKSIPNSTLYTVIMTGRQVIEVASINATLTELCLAETHTHTPLQPTLTSDACEESISILWW